MSAHSREEIERIRATVKRIGDLSDNIVRLGPVKLGLESALEFIPVVGEAYSLLAGGYLFTLAMRARVPKRTLASIAGLVGARTAMGAFDVVPVAGLLGDVVAGLFRAHKISADLILKAMDRTVYVEGTEAEARADPVRAAEIARAQESRPRLRVVFLGVPRPQVVQGGRSWPAAQAARFRARG